MPSHTREENIEHITGLSSTWGDRAERYRGENPRTVRDGVAALRRYLDEHPGLVANPRITAAEFRAQAGEAQPWHRRVSALLSQTQNSNRANAVLRLSDAVAPSAVRRSNASLFRIPGSDNVVPCVDYYGVQEPLDPSLSLTTKVEKALENRRFCGWEKVIKEFIGEYRGNNNEVGNIFSYENIREYANRCPQGSAAKNKVLSDFAEFVGPAQAQVPPYSPSQGR